MILLVENVEINGICKVIYECVYGLVKRREVKNCLG